MDSDGDENTHVKVLMGTHMRTLADQASLNTTDASCKYSPSGLKEIR